METFHMIVLAIATAVLILILTSVGVAINANARTMEWPPNSGRCPDGWTEESDNKCYIPTSLKNSGTVKMLATTPVGYVISDVANAAFTGVSSNILWTHENKWHHAGTAKITNNNSEITSTDGAVLIANNGDNFNYFKEEDEIAIELMLTKTYVAGTSIIVPEYQHFKVKEVTSNNNLVNTKLILKRDTTNGSAFGGTDDAKPKITKTAQDSTTGDSRFTITYDATNSDVKYYGRRVGINFNDAAYKDASNLLTKCKRKDWAKLNSVEWDGVSNYNKC